MKELPFSLLSKLSFRAVLPVMNIYKYPQYLILSLHIHGKNSKSNTSSMPQVSSYIKPRALRTTLEQIQMPEAIQKAAKNWSTEFLRFLDVS